MIDKILEKKSRIEATHYLGTIINNEDPEYKGRCRIRVFGVYDSINDEDLPWAYQIKETSFGGGGGSGRISIPKIGSVVHVTFNHGNYYLPEYRGIQELSPDLINELRESYLGSHSLIFDEIEDIRIFYTTKKGIIIDLKESNVNIKPDNSIVITHKDGSSSVELKGGKITQYADSEIESVATSQIKHSSEEFWADGKTVNLGHVPAYSGVCAEPLWIFLKMLASQIDAKMPTSPGVMSSLADKFEKLSTSDVVKITKSNSDI